MGPDCLQILGILIVIDGYFNRPAVRVQAKVMSGLVMGKSHRFITMFFNRGLMLRGLLHVLFVHGARLHVLRRQLHSVK
jgi:hypothetical membrane protein